MSRKDISNEEATAQISSYGSKISAGDVGAIAAQSEKAIGIFSKARKLVGFVKDVGNVLSMLKDYASGNYKEVPWRIIAALTGSVVYVFSPIDMIPDLIPIVGFADDATVFATVLRFARGDIEKYLEWKRGDGNRTLLPVAANALESEQRQGSVDDNSVGTLAADGGLITINADGNLGDEETVACITKYNFPN